MNNSSSEDARMLSTNAPKPGWAVSNVASAIDASMTVGQSAGPFRGSSSGTLAMERATPRETAEPGDVMRSF